MQDKWKYMVLGAVVGTVVSVVLAAPSLIPSAVADEQPISALETVKHGVADLFRENTEFYKPNWTVEDSVSTKPIRSTTIRKIEAGRMSFVTIAETSSGVYSSDGLDSPHIRYPGIHPDGFAPVGSLSLVLDGRWVTIEPERANSFRD